MPLDGRIRLGGVSDQMVFNADSSRILTSNIEGAPGCGPCPGPGNAVPVAVHGVDDAQPQRRLFATADHRDSTVRLWDELTGKPIATLPIREYQPALEFSGDGSRLVTSHLDGACVSPDENRVVLVAAANIVRI
jgi:WD40 repeat protein